MKRIRQILLAVMVSTVFISCSKDDVDDKDQEPIKKETLSGKWNVDGPSRYKSFEFTESGKYIVVEKLKEQSVRSAESEDDEKVYFGSYEITDRVILLPGLGQVRVSTLKGNSIIFSLYLSPDPKDEVVIKATKQKEMQNTNKTTLLCRTWRTVTLNGEDVTGTDDDIIAVFSNAGTYLVDGSEGLAMASWRWLDKNEEFIQYSWESLGSAVWDNKVKIVNLTASSLTMLEKFDDDEDELWVLKAVMNQQTATAISEIKPTVGKIKGVSLLRQ